MNYRDGVAEDGDEAVGELVGGLGLEEEGVDVVVLDEVAGACADDVERAGDDGFGLGAAGHCRQLRLVLPEVLQLLGQRDRVLDRSHTVAVNQLELIIHTHMMQDLQSQIKYHW